MSGGPTFFAPGRRKAGGMNEHIAKPLDSGRVKATIARYMDRKE